MSDLIFLLAVFSIGPVLFYFMYRNGAVFKFKIKICKMETAARIHAIDNDLVLYLDEWKDDLCGYLPSYGSMLFSFKKLTLENYLDEDLLLKLIPFKDAAERRHGILDS